MSLEPNKSETKGSAAPALRPRSWSIALRLGLLFTIAAAVLLVMAMAAAYWTVVQHVLRDNDRYITEKLAAIRADIAAGAGPESLSRELRIIRAGDKTYAVRVLDSAGHVVAESPHMHATLPIEIFPRTISVKGERPVTLTYRTEDNKIFALVTAVAEVGGRRFTLQLAQDRTHDERFTAHYAALLAGMLGCAVLTCAGIASLVTQRGLRPLKHLAESVERIAVTHLDERVPVTGWPYELQRLAIGFNKMLARLEQSFARLSEFSADLAHELRTPIAILRGEAEGALTKPRSSEQYREVIESSLEELQRLSAMIDNLLFLARTETSGSSSLSYFDGRVAIDKIREFYEAISQDQNVEITCRGDGEVYADPLLFRRAVINLLTNALRFTPAGGSVTVSLDRRNGGSNVSVADTGCGISSQHVPHVFNRFFRGDSPRNAQGTGLGLAIVKSIMKSHDGTVSVESELNKGTVVTLTFPDAQANGALSPQSNHS